MSSSIVGYTTTTLLANDYTMFGVQFEDIQGGGVKFGDLAGNFYGGPSQGEADNILVWKDGVYYYYYYGVFGDDGNPDWDNVWYDYSDDSDATDVAIDAGTACWYLRRTAAESTLTISGAIKVTPTTKALLANDYTMFANPYPTAIKFKDLTIGTPFGGPTQGEADNILVWKDGVYYYYYYGVFGDDGNPDWDNVWYDYSDDSDASDVEIGTGLACWYLRRDTATTLSFASPLAD